MKPLPHHYTVTATATPDRHANLTSEGLNPMTSAPPLQFGGPGDLWSPETLMMAAVADCFVLTFRAVAKAANLGWSRLECGTKGVVDRAEGVTRFTGVHLQVTLTIPSATDAEKARKLLDKTEKGCLVGNSLKCEKTLESLVKVEGAEELKIA
jgi:organic hydroperoxide reductase OsmC/OhrA